MVRWLLLALGLLLIVVIGAVGFLQTGPGKRLLADQLSTRLSTPESGINIAEIEGWIPLDMRIGRLELADRDGTWLTAEDIALEWSPSALVSARIRIDEIRAGHVELLRPPKTDDAPEPVSDEPFRLPELPKSLPPITVERLALPDIKLGESVLGEPASFGLQGSIRATDDGDRVTAQLDFERTDQPTASGRFEATAGLDPPSLDLALNASESGGMIAALAGRPEIGDADVSLEGAGPLDAWSGHLRAEADGLALAEADLGLALVDQPRVTINGGIAPAQGALADELAGLIGEQMTIDLDVVQTRAQALDLRKAVIAAGVATANAEGSADFDRGDLTLQTSLAIADLAPLGALAKAELSGAADAELSIGGTLSAPDGELDLRLAGPAFDGNAATAVTTAVRWTATSPLSSDRPAFDITIDGGAEGLSIPGVVLPDPDPDVGWRGKLSAPTEGEATIESLAIDMAGSSLTAKGAIDPQKLEGRFDLALDAPSLRRLAEPYGQTVDGKALVKAAIRLADRAKDVTVDLDADLSELSGLPPGAAELLGEEAGLQARAELDPSRKLTLSQLALDGAGIELGGDGNLHLDDGDLAGKITLALPDLSLLGALVPEETAGAIELEAGFGGSLDAPSAELIVTGHDLMLASEPITTFGIVLTGQNLIAEPSGKLSIDAAARETPAKLTLAYRLSDGVLNLADIALSAPETDIGGALSVTLETTLIEGALTGRIGDLGAFASLVGQPLAGDVDVTTTLTAEGDRQNADLALQARHVSGDFGALKTLDVDASIADLTSEPGVDGKATVTGFEQDGNKIDALTLTANGDKNALDFQLDVAGEVIETLEIGTAGRVAFADGLALDLGELEGAIAGEPLRLAKPLSLRQNGDRISLADLDLRLGKARLSGYVELDEQTANGAIDLRALPLRWSEVFGGPALNGEANADIDLSGDVGSPKVIASLVVDGLIAGDVAPAEVPLGISLKALLDQGRLAANLEASRVTRKPITATASLPARLSLRPFAFDMPEDGALDGRIDAEILLARLADVLALDDQRLDGRLTADLTIGGTLGEPDVTGPVVLEDAKYENDASATYIHSLNMEAIASTERIDVKSFTGRTGKTGRLEAEGWLELDADTDFPLSVSVKLDKAELVDRDDIDGRISGDIALTGSLAQAEINGDLTVNRAEIAIPDGGGPSLPALDVTEVGGDIVNPVGEEEEEAKREKHFDPALNVRIRLPNRIYVRGRGLESEWEGNLDITGRASEPIIVGSIRIKKGHFDFLDKRFELTLGEITFSGGTPPNPIIALEAVSEDDDFTAILRLDGPADDPKLLLSSEPILPEDEILSRLLFNRELSQIGPVEAGKLARAVNRLRGGGGFDAFGEIRGILKIDTLDVVSDEEGDAAVKAGKYLNEDVYVEVEKGAGEESGRVRVEIELLPNIALEADTSENADSGVGVKWKFDY
ncbi:MAG: translocation/assembly module TamB domain-containing protein [Geminicoccaceae bacterium]